MLKEKLTVTIIGTGNVATHLYKALSSNFQCASDFQITSQKEILLINSRTLEGLPEHSDIILIAVKDDAINEVAKNIKGKADIIAHTSGSIGIDVLENCADNYGVFYPLQTFSKDKELNYQEIPFFIEGNTNETVALLKKLAERISTKVYEADSAKRKRLHVAAVFACNFSNHLVEIADQLLKEDGMDYKVLLPLLKETVKKLYLLSPAEAQTGPAIRNDQNVMTAHEEMLEYHPEWRTIYHILSSSIQKNNCCG